MDASIHLRTDQPVSAHVDTYTDFLTLEVAQDGGRMVFFVRSLEQALAIQNAAAELVRKAAELQLGVTLEEVEDASVGYTLEDFISANNTANGLNDWGF